MLRCVASFVAGGIWCIAVGCWGGSFLSRSPGSTCERVVHGSPAEVSATLEAEMADAGAVVLEKKQKEGTSLVGSISGKMFLVTLKPVKDRGSEKTAVVFKWGREADERFGRKVELVLAGMTSAPECDPKQNAEE
jgi:hypothetical protein